MKINDENIELYLFRYKEGMLNAAEVAEAHAALRDLRQCDLLHLEGQVLIQGVQTFARRVARTKGQQAQGQDSQGATEFHRLSVCV